MLILTIKLSAEAGTTCLGPREHICYSASQSLPQVCFSARDILAFSSQSHILIGSAQACFLNPKGLSNGVKNSLPYKKI